MIIKIQKRVRKFIKIIKLNKVKSIVKIQKNIRKYI